LLAVRRRERALFAGDYVPLPRAGDLSAFVRGDGSSRWLVVLNLGANDAAYRPPDGGARGEVVISTYPDRRGEAFHGTVTRRPHEGLLTRLDDR